MFLQPPEPKLENLQIYLQHHDKFPGFDNCELRLQHSFPFLARLFFELKEHGINLSVETNGTIPVPDIIDWICVSPKDQVYPNVSIKQRVGDELKVVYCGQDLSMYDDLKQGFEHHFIQPCYMENDTVEQNGKSFAVVENMVKNNPGWRLSLQTHKWMGVD
mgnify:CR=1 FL=1